MLYNRPYPKDVVSRVGHKSFLMDIYKQLKEAKDKETTQVAVASAS
ncbi:hypothetical protein AALP_AA8G330600 [Arabis alpina]|uniref:Uncharacterized protein n=1 Tax=Arabis alpina TaxID=50452 RepID=A0A087GB20_ARAAL|nr:hypothetical protein AALP_AA8G330600 [Arabis alpina]